VTKQLRSPAAIVIVIATLLAAMSWSGREGRAERAEPASRLVLGRPMIRGSMPASLVKEVLWPHLARLEACLALEGAPRVSITARILFLPGGPVRFAGLTEGALRPMALQCLTAEIESATCESHPPGIDLVDLPMTFDRR
jgi:hypothetical protein